MKRNILIIGCSSKIAKKYIEESYSIYNIYATYNRALADLPNGIKELYSLNLNSKSSILEFLKNIKEISFSGVLFFASTYSIDSIDAAGLYEQILEDQQVNVFGPCLIARSLKYEKLGRVFFFSDAGRNNPRENYLSYNISKQSLENINKLLATELHDRAITICFAMGPVLAPEGTSNINKYYNRNLISTGDITLGLARYINFIIDEPNLSMTGVTLYYDGGTYLRRLDI